MSEAFPEAARIAAGLTPWWRATIAALPASGEFSIAAIRPVKVRDNLIHRRRFVARLGRHDGGQWLYAWTPIGAAVRACVESPAG